MGLADSHRAIRSVLWGVLKRHAAKFRHRGIDRMLKQIVCRGPSLFEQVAGPLAFAIAYSLGLGLLVSLVVFLVAVCTVQAWLKPDGPSRWTE